MFGRQALRSVCSRTKPEIGQPLSNYFRQFSTSARFEAEESNNRSNAQDTPTSSLRQRTKAATDEIRSLNPNRQAQGGANQARAPGSEAAARTNGAPKVIDVRSLPRGGLRGRGGPRGGARGGLRGGAAGPGGPGGPGGPRASSPGATNRFSGDRGAGSRGRARGRRGGRGGRGGKRGGRRDGEGEQGEGGLQKRRERKIDESDLIEPAEKEFDDYIRFGTRTNYTPSLNFESLAEYMPPVASNSAKKASTILQNLSYLGTGERVATPQGLQASNYAASATQGGMDFFADVESRRAAEEYLQKKRYDEAVAKAKADAPEGTEPAPVEMNTEPIIKDVEDSIKKAILEQAVAGKYEAPKPPTDPVTISRNWHLRAETWTEKETQAFEAKLTSLLAKGNKGPAKKAGAKA